MAALQTPRSRHEELRIDTAQHTWCFDRRGRRFRRVPRGVDPDDPAVEPAWHRYWCLSRGDGGSLTVVLDREGTLRLRVVD
jgi:hypothetical protein